MSSQTFEMTFTAEAEVLRGCCGKSHEFGQCPCSNSQSSEEN